MNATVIVTVPDTMTRHLRCRWKEGLGKFPFSFYATANEVLALLLASEINVN